MATFFFSGRVVGHFDKFFDVVKKYLASLGWVVGLDKVNFEGWVTCFSRIPECYRIGYKRIHRSKSLQNSWQDKWHSICKGQHAGSTWSTVRVLGTSKGNVRNIEEFLDEWPQGHSQHEADETVALSGACHVFIYFFQSAMLLLHIFVHICYYLVLLATNIPNALCFCYTYNYVEKWNKSYC